MSGVRDSAFANRDVEVRKAQTRRVSEGAPVRPAGEKLTIYLIEDNPDDRGLTMRALNLSQLPVQVEVATDGVEAVEALGIENGEDHAPARPPDLIICDLKMPRLAGDEVLSRARSSSSMQSVPFVMLSSSAHHADIERCMGLGATAYCLKPIDFDAYIRCVQSIVRRWLVDQATHPECMLKCSEEPA